MRTVLWTEKEYRAATVRERAANNSGMPKCPPADARGSEGRAMNAGLCITGLGPEQDLSPSERSHRF